MARFRLEYLTETTEEDSGCRMVAPEASTLREAGDVAFLGFAHARRAFGAAGFQIRDMSSEEALRGS